MPTSIKSDDVQAVLNQARSRKLTPSPEDWRDQWIYFLMVDRLNNPASAPKHLPYDMPLTPIILSTKSYDFGAMDFGFWSHPHA